MKWLYGLLALALLFMFAMPLMGADSGPQDALVIEQAVTDTLDPVPTLEAQDSLLTPLLAVIKTGSVQNSAYESQHQVGMTAQDSYAYLQWPNPLRLMHPHIAKEYPPWVPEGVVAFFRCTEPSHPPHII